MKSFALSRILSFMSLPQTRAPACKSLLVLALCTLSACSSLGLESEGKYEDKQKKDLYKNGSVISDEGGTSLFEIGGGKKSDNTGIGVNGYLWRAALDTLSFLPINTADPFGGVITTDWYATTEAPNERIKLNVLILDRELRADGVKITVFKQIRTPEGEWKDTEAAPSTGSQLEETVLTRARQMRLAQLQQN